MSTNPVNVEPPRSDLADRWLRFRRETRGGGALYAMHSLMHGPLLPRRFLDFGSVHIIALDLQAIPAPTEGAAAMHRARPRDIDALTARARRKDAYRKRFDLGSEVWIAEQAGMPVAYDVSGAKTKDLARWLRLEAPEGETWAITIWVAPEARGQGLAVQLRRRVAQEFRSAGFVRLLGTIRASNTRSVRTFRKLGATFIGRVYYVWLFGFGVVLFDGRLQAGHWTSRRRLTLRPNR
jgi:ribosomal protein S18 acetylase RimI-like enzyme